MVKCTVCGAVVGGMPKWQEKRYLETGRAYCGRDCSKAYQKQVSSRTATATNLRLASARMAQNNPSKKAEVREKISQTLKRISHAPHQRGGNGKGITYAESLLVSVLYDLGFVWNVVVKTGAPRGNGVYPPCYKLDVGNFLEKVGVEADGGSHGALARQNQDLKKDNFLSGLGWKVFRYTNQEIMDDPQKIRGEVLAFITSRSKGSIPT